MPDAINNPNAYGSVPVIPPTSTNTSTSESTWSPNLPNYDALASAASMIAQNQMAGQLNPQDLANAQQWSAERGVGTGTGFGSPNNMAAYQQFLGLSAQKLEQQGLTNYEGLLAGAPRTTDTTGTQTTDNNVLKAEYAAAPDPYAAAMANLAAQRAGMAGGAGSGVSQGSGTAAALRAAQQAAALAGMGGGNAGAGGSTDNVSSLGGGSFGVFGNMGQDWENLFSDQGSSSWQQMGYPSEQAYNDAIDASIFGWDTADGGGGSGGAGPTLNPDTGIYDYGSGYTGGYGGSGQSPPIYGQDIYDPNNAIFGGSGAGYDAGWGGSGAGGGIDQTVYNPATDQSQYNYGIPDYYGTGYDTSGGGGYVDPYAGTYWDTGGGDYYDGG
jgi:hypothetical protein